MLRLVASLVPATTVVLSSRDLDDVEAICDFVGILEAGQLRYQGSLADLLAGADQSRWRTVVRPPADATIYHTYSAYARGLDGLWGMYQWLDRAPRGRNEARGPGDPLNWCRRRHEYDHANGASK